MEPLMTAKEVAAYLGVHVKSVDRWASQGIGPTYTKVGGVRRYGPADIRAWIENGKTPTQGPAWRCSGCGKAARTDAYLVTSIEAAVIGGHADWGIFHYGCNRPAVAEPYIIDIADVDTWPKLTDRIAHLWEKSWAHNTDIAGLLRKTRGAR